MNTPMSHDNPQRGGRPYSKLPLAWREFVDAYGGKKALAALLGVHESTLHRWTNKGKPLPLAVVRWIGELAVAKGLSNPLETVAPVCPKCGGDGWRALTPEERKDLGKGAPISGVVECECQAP